MTQESTSSFEKIRDEALRAFITRMRLTPQQISALKLSQVHLATSSLVIEPDEFTSTAGAAERPVVLNLDGETQRTIVTWLVVRPDGPNNHLFPGTDLDPIDLATIERVAAAAAAQKPAEIMPSSPAGTQAPELTAADQAPQAQASQAAALDEIEALRKELAAAEQDWSRITGSEAAISAEEQPVAEERPVPEATPPRQGTGQRPSVAPSPPRLSREASTARPRAPGASAPRATTPAEERAAEPAMRVPFREPAEYEERRAMTVPYPILAVAAAILVLACCASLVTVGFLVLGPEGIESLVAGIIPLGTEAATATPTPAPAPRTATPSPTFTAMPAPTDTPKPTQAPTKQPAKATAEPKATPKPPTPTPTPVIIVVTATPTPQPPPTARLAATSTPVPAESPVPTETLTATYKYTAPVLLEPANDNRMQGRLLLLKWQSVGNLADDEWYAIRLIYLQQGQPVYQGDDVKTTDWRVPERFYYQADGPALQYRWYVYVESKNPDGSATQLSPNSEEFVFKWE
jgi:hypothetical protein